MIGGLNRLGLAGIFGALYTSAPLDPTMIDDADDGYRVGSRWINTLTQEEWLCLDATPSAAVWVQTGGGGGGGPLALGGDLAGSTDNAEVLQVRPAGTTTLGYDGSGRLETVTVAGRGTKTLTYDGSGRLTGVVGTGIYSSLTLGYDGGGNLVSVGVS